MDKRKLAKTTINLPLDLREALDRAAELKNRTMNQQVIEALMGDPDVYEEYEKVKEANKAVSNE